MRFNHEKVKDVIEFIESLKHTKSHRGKSFKLDQWQKDILAKTFGPMDEHGRQLITRSLWMISKKNGKTELLAAIAIFLLLGQSEKRTGQEIVMCASSAGQARHMFDAALEMILQNPHLCEMCKPYRSTKRIVYPALGNVIVVISSDADRIHGLNPSAVLADEINSWKKDEIWGILDNSMSTRGGETLWISATHAGYDKGGLAYREFDRAKKIQNGILEDNHFLPVLFYADEEEDWTSEAVWRKCNPAIGSFFDLEELRRLCNEAKMQASKQNEFRMYRLNQFVGQAVRWLPMEHWKLCPKPNLDDLKGQQCFGGLDMAPSSDFSSFCLYFPETHSVIAKFWLNEEALAERPEYKAWKGKFITFTDGNITDYHVVRDDIIQLAQIYNIKKICADKFQSTSTQIDLGYAGLTCETMGQGFASYTQPSRELERLILSHQLKHDNPVLTWMASNVACDHDTYGNIRPSKKKAVKTGKVDGICALVMAISASQPKENKKLIRRGVVRI